MKIELKKFKHFPSLSEETTAFTADVFCDGRLIAHAKNDGHGGATWLTPSGITPDEKVNGSLFQKACAYFEAQSPYNGGGYNNIPMSLDFKVDLLTDRLVREVDIKKSLAKIKRVAIKSFVVMMEADLELFKSGKSTSISYHEFKYNIPLATIPTEKLKSLYEKHKADLKEGELFFNTFNF